MLNLGVIGTSRKENERRIPIHLDHVPRIPNEFRRQLLFEKGYGERMGVSDAHLAAQSGGLAERRVLLEESDVVLLNKPVNEDFAQIREGGIFWGWPHCVQKRAITQIAIDRKLTVIAFEAMFNWTELGARGTHTFYRNNEMAGYCSVLHALALMGIDGYYDRHRRVVVLSFGSVSRGALHALKGRGFNDIIVYTQRPIHLLHDQILGCHYAQLRRSGPGESQPIAQERDGSQRPLIEALAEADIIVNGILQDTDNPLMYFEPDELARLKAGSLIIDVSCDEGIGFPFAKPTTFEKPMFEVGHCHYYAVDHTPTYLWESASREISAALLPYLHVVLGGPEHWAKSETIRRAIEVREGVVQNPKILSFQHRSAEYPHPVMD